MKAVRLTIAGIAVLVLVLVVAAIGSQTQVSGKGRFSLSIGDDSTPATK